MRILTVCIILVLAAACSSPSSSEPAVQDTSEADAAAIRAVVATEVEGVASGDAETFMAAYSDDVIVMSPNAPATVGKAAARAWAEEFFALGTMDQFEHVKDELVVAGDWAYERWSISLSMTLPDPGLREGVTWRLVPRVGAGPLERTKVMKR